MTRSFVLVHGGWHGGWCWQRVRDRLSAAGHRVYAPSLTGLSDRQALLSPEVNLSTHVTEIAALIECEELSDVVLVGHSYGGFVISGVAERIQSAIDTMVFLDAFVPDDGDCAQDFAPPFPAVEVGSGLAVTEVVLPVPAELFQVNESDRAWVDRRSTPHPVACMNERIALTGAREKVRRRIYVRAVDFETPVLDVYFDHARNSPEWEAYALHTYHDLMVDAPREVADILLSLV